jgi:hypothetical protein
MDDTRLTKTTSESRKNCERLKRGCHNDVKCWLNNCTFSFIVKLDIELFSKHNDMKESVTFWTLKGLKMKITFSYSALDIPKLNLNFKIFVTIPVFVTF